MATGAEDHVCRVWDLRQRQCSYQLPAHSSLLSTVRFQPVHGNFLLTAGYDNLAKVHPALQPPLPAPPIFPPV